MRVRVAEPVGNVAEPRSASRVVVEMPLLMVLVSVSACMAVTTDAMAWPAMLAAVANPTDTDVPQKVLRLGLPRVPVWMLVSVQRAQPVVVR